ncbi:MAG TPA: cyclase family protein [Burkholderiaceae bacterium]|jgi:kynurenine formamidase|nr:cyclase family protein [Burkholderiaceae bacterium]
MKLKMLCIAAMLAGSVANAQDVKCEKSKYGADDQIGALNTITEAKRLEAVKLVKRGKAIRMGIETNSKTPAFPPRTFTMTILTPGQVGGATLGETKTTYNDDIVSGWLGIGSQIDGLGHIGIDNVYYNCVKAQDFVQADGLKKYGIETLPAIATRAVILDMVALTGKDPVPEGTAFNRKEIDAAMQRQNVNIGKGDVVLFHTGWTKLIGKDDKRYGSVEPGLGVEGARYLASLEVALVGADTWGVEVLPFEDPNKLFLVHQILIAQHGIMLLENVVSEEAIKDGVYEGLFTLGVHRMTGAVQGIINPVLMY